MSIEDTLREEGNSPADIERLAKMFEEIEEANPTMPPEIYKPDATIEIDSTAGGQSLDDSLFSADQIKKLRSLGKKLFAAKTEKAKAKAKEEIFAIIEDYVEYFHPEDLYTLEVSEGGWIGHLSMPGYMDQTDPTHYDTLAEAIEEMHSMYVE